MKNSTITTKKLLVRGIPSLKIIAFDNVLSYDDLPKNYLTSYPHYYKSGETIVIYCGAGHVYRLSVDQIYPREYVNTVISYMKLSGTRLAIINKEIKKLSRHWNESESIISI